MNKLLKTITLVVLTMSAFAQDKEQIIKVLRNQQASWNKGDIDEFMHSYWKSDSLLFVGKAGPNYGWQTTMNNYKKHYPDKATMGKLDFNILKVALLGKADAFVLGAWKVNRTKDSIGGYFTLWFRKFKNG